MKYREYLKEAEIQQCLSSQFCVAWWDNCVNCLVFGQWEQRTKQHGSDDYVQHLSIPETIKRRKKATTTETQTQASYKHIHEQNQKVLTLTMARSSTRFFNMPAVCRTSHHCFQCPACSDSHQIHIISTFPTAFINPFPAVCEPAAAACSAFHGASIMQCLSQWNTAHVFTSTSWRLWSSN